MMMEILSGGGGECLRTAEDHGARYTGLVAMLISTSSSSSSSLSLSREARTMPMKGANLGAASESSMVGKWIFRSIRKCCVVKGGDTELSKMGLDCSDYYVVRFGVASLMASVTRIPNTDKAQTMALGKLLLARYLGR